MKKSDVFPSKYLKAADLQGKPRVLVIESAPLETLKNPEGKEQSKTVLYFVHTKKALPLNVVNWDSVSDIAGPDTDDWPGSKIEVFPTKTEMGGKIVDCIRVRPPAQGEMAVVPKAAKPAAKPKPKSKLSTST